jgi:hypothetical protein
MKACDRLWLLSTPADIPKFLFSVDKTGILREGKDSEFIPALPPHPIYTESAFVLEALSHQLEGDAKSQLGPDPALKSKKCQGDMQLDLRM